MTPSHSPMIRLFLYLRSYYRRFFLSCGASITNKILDLMPPLLVAWVIDSLRGDIPGWLRNLFDKPDPYSAILVLSGLTVIIFSLESLFQWLYQRGFMTLAQDVQHDLRVDAYNRLQSREMAFFDEHRMGETMAMLNDDVNQLERFLNGGFNDFVQLTTLFFFAGVVLFASSPGLALVGLSPLPFIIWGSLKYRSIIAPRYGRVREAVGKLSSRLENNLAGMTVIKSFTAEKFESERVAQSSREYRDANFRAIKLNALYVPLIRLLIALGFAAVLAVGGWMTLKGKSGMTPGALVLFAMMTQRLLWPLTAMGKTLDQYERTRACARRVFGLLDSRDGISDPETPVRPETEPRSIEFQNVDFSYGNDIPALNGLDFRVRPGETLGIAGPTGAGKTTVIKLLLRLYDADRGSILLGGNDLRRLSQEFIRENIALVSQDVYLFHGSIRENIAYGSPRASREDVLEASRAANLHDFVSGLPLGYDTIVGERGIRLSGGQRQRLSIARAVLKNAPILVLDEATSSVDTETERAIQRNLQGLIQDKTALIIAHRLSSIRAADRIIVIDEGRATEEGRHEELLERGGLYAELWNIQAGAARS